MKAQELYNEFSHYTKKGQEAHEAELYNQSSQLITGMTSQANTVSIFLTRCLLHYAWAAAQSFSASLGTAIKVAMEDPCADTVNFWFQPTSLLGLVLSTCIIHA